MSTPQDQFPEIIQGGMGVGVSNWNLAKAVSKVGQLGVVSGTALDTVLVRRLQMGDISGDVRRAMAAYPDQDLAQAILDKYFIDGGKAADKPFKVLPMAAATLTRRSVDMMMMGTFVEVYLAKEGHDGVVGINLLEKIQLPTIPTLFGAMLAGVDYVLMGGGIPLTIPGILDGISKIEPVELKLHVTGGDEAFVQEFNPDEYCPVGITALKRPKFVAVISSDTLARTLVKRATGHVDGFVVEHHSAGGHNAPPRRGSYGPRDEVDLEKMRALGRPFWLAGGCASYDMLEAAKLDGATGVQVGTAFAYCRESGILPEIKAEVIEKYFAHKLVVETDFDASPTGYPIKLIELDGYEVPDESTRVCDLGYLRSGFVGKDGKVAFRCPSSPVNKFVERGGCSSLTEGKQCLCNGLLSTIGLGQVRDGEVIPPIVTSGADFSFLRSLLESASDSYGAEDVIAMLRGATPVKG